LVPNLKERLIAFDFIVNFENKKIELIPDIEKISNATKYLKESERVKKILEIILHVGNFLNNGNSRLGNAFGFTLETLKGLSDTKTTDNSATILEVIIELIKDSDKPGVIDELTKKEVDIIEAGSKSSLQTIQGDVGKLSKDFDLIKSFLTSVEPSSEEDKFHAKLEAFVNVAQSDVDNIVKSLEQTIKDFEALVAYYGEDLKDNDPESFFGKWKVFLNNVYEAREKILQEREKQEKLKRREESKQRTVSRGTMNNTGGGENTGGTENRGRGRGFRGRGRGTGQGQQQVVDELFSKLKDGGILKKKTE